MCDFGKTKGLALLAALTLAASGVLAQGRPAPMTGGMSANFRFGAGGILPQSGFQGPGANPLVGPNVGFANPYAALTTTPNLPANPGFGGDLANTYTNPYGSYGSNPYGGYGSPYGYYESPLGGYLRGYADVISSIGRMEIDEQRAKLVRQEVQRERLENWKRHFDYWRYWRENVPTAEDDRQRYLQQQLTRSLNEPPLGEIYSGQAMNTLLDNLAKKVGTASDLRGGSAALDADTLRHLNLTATPGKGNPGLLKNEGRLKWPAVLRDPQYKPEYDELNNTSPVIYDQAVSGRVDPVTLEKMTNAVRNLQRQLSENVRDMTPSQYADARRFLSNFEDALTLLGQPGAGEFFTQKAARGRTIGELVQHMLIKGLRFAPAVAGDEAAYVAAYGALANFYASVAPQVAADRPEKEK